MPDEVWPLPPGKPVRMGTYNGIGTELKGFTRPDASGRYFATRYACLVGLPLVPLDRYHLSSFFAADNHF